jgi:hypothetical protein
MDFIMDYLNLINIEARFVSWCQLPNPKGLGRTLHRCSIVIYGCSGAIYCHRNTTLPIIFRKLSRRFQGVRFIPALQGLRVLYPLTPPSKFTLPARLIRIVFEIHETSDNEFVLAITAFDED